MNLVAFCEAAADFAISSHLVERLLDPEVPDWRGEGDRDFYTVKRVHAIARARRLGVPHGHFDGKPGAAGATMARTVFWLCRDFAKTQPLDGVVLVWDMDDQPEDRSRGLDQARTEATRLASFRIVIGRANPNREAWVLVGFDAETDEERERLEELRQELGYPPNQDAHRLTAKHETDKHNGKRVLRALTDGDHDREARAWRDTSLATLRARGRNCGLAEFLAEIEEHLVPLRTAR
jgi:hypothetical protein